METKVIEESEKENWFEFSGEEGYYGRLCENYGKRCDQCKWQDAYRCRDGAFRG